jgi:predicted CoA-binding protein
MTAMERIQDFLGQKRLAFVGVSSRPAEFSRMLFREFRARGYDAIPVHPGVAEMDGQKCFARLQDIDPPPDGALLLTVPGVTDQVVRDCAEAGMARVWMFRAGGAGAVSADAIAYCAANAISVVPGECPFMFLPGTPWFHRLHGFVKKIAGSYPR